jgi:hypothetical protein
MPRDQNTWGDKIQHHEVARVDAVSRRGVPAAWKAHMRELTAARQAAKRCHAQPAVQPSQDTPIPIPEMLI